MGVKMEGGAHAALTYGTILHEVLPKCYAEPLDVVLDEFVALMKDSGIEDDKKRNIEAGSLLLENFWNSHHGSKCAYTPIVMDVDTVKTDKVSEGEIPFTIDIGASFPFAGRIDLPVRLNATKELWALDFKSTSEVSTRFFTGFDNHPQALGYTLALSVLTGEKVAGFCVEAVRVAPIPKRPSTVPPNLWHLVYVNEAQLRWFIKWAQETSEKMKVCNDMMDWPRNPCGCSPYAAFGMPGFSCPYKPICKLDENEWTDALRYFTVEEPWHPFEME